MNIYSALPYQCIFMHKYFHLERKSHMICIFAVILIFLLASDHVVEKTSVSHTNENRWTLLIIDSYNPTKIQPSSKSIKINTLHDAPGNPKRYAEVSESHKMFAPLQHNIFYDWKHHLKPFVLGGALKPWEEDDQANKSMRAVFVEPPLSSPRSAN